MMMMIIIITVILLGRTATTKYCVRTEYSILLVSVQGKWAGDRTHFACCRRCHDF